MQTSLFYIYLVLKYFFQESLKRQHGLRRPRRRQDRVEPAEKL